MASVSHSKVGGTVTVTIRPLSTSDDGKDTTGGVSKNFEIAKIGKPEKDKKAKSSKDSRLAGEKRESAELRDHAVESTRAKKFKISGSDFGDPDDAPEPAMGADSMTDMSRGMKFKFKKSSKSKSKDKGDE